MIRHVFLTLALCLSMPSLAAAQLADAGKNDQYLSFFFQRSGRTGDWVGGVTSQGDRLLDRSGRFTFAWQLDYGSLDESRITATGTEPDDEAAVSKNSGTYTVRYSRRFGSTWRLTGEGGAEHKRARDDDDSSIDQSVDPIAALGLRNIGSRLVGYTSDPDRADKAPELAWSLLTSLTSSSAIVSGGTPRALFVDPVGTVWLSIVPTTTAMTATTQPQLFYRIQLRVEVAAMRGLNEDVGVQGHWDTSVVYFFSPSNGVMLRRFSGYFDHNLRDRKNATTVNLVWKFN